MCVRPSRLTGEFMMPFILCVCDPPGLQESLWCLSLYVCATLQAYRRAYDAFHFMCVRPSRLTGELMTPFILCVCDPQGLQESLWRLSFYVCATLKAYRRAYDAFYSMCVRPSRFTGELMTSFILCVCDPQETWIRTWVSYELYGIKKVNFKNSKRLFSHIGADKDKKDLQISNNTIQNKNLRWYFIESTKISAMI